MARDPRGPAREMHDAICRKIKEMVDLDFLVYRSLYYTEHLVSSGSSSRYPLNGSFCIGPHCGTRYWDCSAGESRYYHHKRPNPGPWRLSTEHSDRGHDMDEYCDGLIDAGFSSIPPSISEEARRPSYDGSIDSHQAILEKCRTVLKTMAAASRIKSSSKPVLLHPDLHTRNIFVSENDPIAITGIIDWQGASIELAFWYSDGRPDYATPMDPRTMSAPARLTLALNSSLPLFGALGRWMRVSSVLFTTATERGKMAPWRCDTS
ncbi:uncharacterized protein ACLA_078350 [Aspergillus clavatus NRRL 1]|uniref:Altered inheritance of mitochondria protein 9, mitochondrial n=1 Tax=Aspergillus clavatus (strain ATCC 1007 / CBS 513.65 / DSM 816 / NCTC 3887 / NRRL 1 / QM 1276 / 107) TaxID=344612 RepID=A1CLV8_ASPCL|nr:uncharacterized protein ACLA_078350 [Aspergillus clavatus NRRL 1]EAW09087.1 hypothetical protein ACLA_078350 [Aspergillus clavatus NRRL 1]